MTNEKSASLSFNKKYEIVCDVKGSWKLDIRVCSLVTGKKIDCKVE